MKLGPIGPDLYSSLPLKMESRKRNPKELWNIVKLPYGVVEASSKRLNTSDEWMLKYGRMKRVFRINLIFYQRHVRWRIVLLVAQTRDEFLASGMRTEIESFFERMKTRFEIGKDIISSNIKLNGSEIRLQDDSGIIFSIDEYVERLKQVELSRTRRTQVDELATEGEN